MSDLTSSQVEEHEDASNKHQTWGSVARYVIVQLARAVPYALLVWPPSVPAVSRCRARQHHGQAVSLAPDAPGTVKMSQTAGRNAAHCPGRPLQRQGHPKIVSNRFAETIFRTHP